MTHDPGKRVDVHLTTKEWKALAVMAKDFGWSLKDTARWAINSSVGSESALRSHAQPK